MSEYKTIVNGNFITVLKDDKTVFEYDTDTMKGKAAFGEEWLLDLLRAMLVTNFYWDALTDLKEHQVIGIEKDVVLKIHLQSLPVEDAKCPVDLTIEDGEKIGQAS